MTLWLLWRWHFFKNSVSPQYIEWLGEKKYINNCSLWCLRHENLFRNSNFSPKFWLLGPRRAKAKNHRFFFHQILLPRTMLKILAEKNSIKLNHHRPWRSKCRTTLVTAPSPYLIYLIIIITQNMEKLSPLHQIGTASCFSLYNQSLPFGTQACHKTNQFFFSGADQGGPKFLIFHFLATFRLIERRQSHQINIFFHKKLSMDKFFRSYRKTRSLAVKWKRRAEA